MMHSGWWFTLLGTWVLLWQETGENPAFFCYRIACGMFSSARAFALATVPVNPTDHSAARNNAECLTPSFIFFTRFSTPKGSKN